MKTKIFFTSLLIAVFFLTSLSYSGVKSVGWQGRVVDSGTGHPLHGNYTIIYSIYPSASGGSPLWTETQSTFIDSGIAQVLLGSVTPIPDSVFNGSVRFFGVKVGSDPEMSPRSEMVSAPYARYAFAGGGWKDSGNVVTLATGTDNVGIGTNAPQYKLDVNGDAHVSGLLKIGQTSLWGRGTNGNEAIGSTNLIKMIIDSDNDQTNQYFSVVRDEPQGGTPAGTELFRVQENGNVGIGTINPSWDLTFGYATTREIGVERAVMGDGATLKIHAGNAFDDAITEHDGGDLYLYGGGGVYNGIDGDVILAHTGANPRGNVGIGTTEPGAKLEVKDHPYAVYSNGPPVGYFGTETVNKIALVGDATYGLSTNLPTGKSIGVFGYAYGGTENWSGYFVGDVYAGGNVGIGTTSPQAKLDINGTTFFGDVAKIKTGQRIQSEYDGGMRILGEQGNTPAKPAIGFFSTNGIDDGGGGNGIFRPLANTMAFATVSQERMRISSVGNVGIGTTNPQGALDVSSTTGAFIVPRMTTTQRDALTAVNGMIIYNTTTNQFNFRENGAWVTK